MPDVPSADELAVLPAAELAARLSEAYRVIREMTVQAEQLTAQAETLSAQVGCLQAWAEDLERRAGRDSSTSSRPPSSDNPYKKKGRDRSSRGAGEAAAGQAAG